MSAKKNISNPLMDDNRNDTLSIDPDMRMDDQRDEGRNESSNNLSHPDEVGSHDIKESIEPDVRMNAPQLKMPEDDDTLVHDKIDTLNDTDKYSGYEVSIHDNNETPPSAKDNIKENSADLKTSAIKHLITEPHNREIEAHHNHEAKKAFDDIKKNDDTHAGSALLDNAIEDTTMSPGERLRFIREQNNMSVKHVADRLYLDARVIEALEADNYEKLPPTLFVRGYLRNYAKLMDISPESIMASFEEKQQKSAPSLTAPFKRKKQASRNDLWPTVVTIVVIVTLMILIALWQFYPSMAIGEFPLLTNSHDESLWPSDTDFEHDTNHKTEIDDRRIAADEPFSSTNNVESPPVSSVVVEPEANIPPLSAKENNTIKMHFKQKVWMRITDKTKKQLFQGIGKAGEVLSFDGLPPFKMMVGNFNVDIEYKGEIKNIKEYPGRRRAFIVGAE